jgi:hypothetical protein
MMKNIGIKKVYYTTGNQDELISEHVKDMISIQSSAVTKLIDTLYNPFDKEIYYNKLLKTYFPYQVKHYNLECFINYNLKNIFPNYKINIENNKINIKNNKINIKNNKVYIYNENNKIITESYILN